MRNPASVTRSRIRSTKASYGVSPHRLVEGLDDGHLDAGGRQPLQPLLRVDEQRRRGAHQDLVGVMVEGDDRRACAARRRLRHQVLEEVGVAEVEPVEDADDHEHRPESGLEALDPGDDVHHG